MNVAIWLWVVVQVWQAPPASLGEAALREAVRRQVSSASAFQLTDAEIGPPPPRPAAPPPATAADAAAKAVDPAAKAAGGETAPVKDQAWWQARLTTARETLTRNRLLLDALASRIAALDADIAGRDDPAQRAILMQAREAALTERERLTKQVAADAQAIEDIREEGRKAGVPPGWIR